jgi:hypothetical protein
MCPNFQSHSEGYPNSLDKGWEQDPTSNDVQVALELNLQACIHHCTEIVTKSKRETQVSQGPGRILKD